MFRALSGLLILSAALHCEAQLPVEAFVGHERTTADVLWFRYFTHASGENTRFLFFNRSRASVDYSNQTAFGLTNAVSYNFKSGIGLVAVAQFLGTGFLPKAGFQYVVRKKKFTLFTWVVSETWSNPAVDWFVLTRFQPPLTEKINLFTQLELLNTAYPEDYYQFIQRIRLGVGNTLGWQIGMGADFQQAGSETFTRFNNMGIFLRKEF
jgi:hypothetical protein